MYVYIFIYTHILHKIINCLIYRVAYRTSKNVSGQTVRQVAVVVKVQYSCTVQCMQTHTLYSRALKILSKIYVISLFLAYQPFQALTAFWYIPTRTRQNRRHLYYRRHLNYRQNRRHLYYW
jgi:hypothetical protein